MRIRALFAWYDCWVGFYWDGLYRRLYVFPLPMLGFVIDLSPPGWDDLVDAKDAPFVDDTEHDELERAE